MSLRGELDAMTDEERAELFARWPQSVSLALAPDDAEARRIGWRIMDAASEQAAGRGLEVEHVVDVSVGTDVVGCDLVEATVVLRGPVPSAWNPSVPFSFADDDVEEVS